MPTRRKVMRTKPAGQKVLRTKPTKRRVKAVAHDFWKVVATTKIKIPLETLIDSIVCTGGTVEAKEDSEIRHHQIRIYPGYPDTPWVETVPHHETWWSDVPCSYIATSTGFSFSGAYPICTATGVCANGAKKFTQISLEGELNTSLEPDELSYTYAIYTYCGNLLTCAESGTFKGTREEGTGLEGKFVGTQTWKVHCCTARLSFE